MKINGIDYDLVWLSNDEFNNLGNNVHCEKYKKDTLIVNRATLDYFHCGEGRNRPKKDIRNELKKALSGF